MVTYIAVIIILMKPINTYLLKKWIGNERRKRTLAERMQDENLSESVDVKGPPMKRMSSGYNIFTSKMLSSGTRYYYDYNYNFPTRCSITYFNTCLSLQQPMPAVAYVASLKMYSCYVNFKSLSLFISLEIHCFYSLWTQKYLHSRSK